MGKLSPFCTCTNLNCPLHPTKHDHGCAPCIRKNLLMKELPNCFFDQVDNGVARAGDSFEEFARLVLRTEEAGSDRRS